MSALRLPIVTKCVRSCLVHACPRHNQGEDVAKSTRSDHHVTASGRCDMSCSRVGVLTSLPDKASTNTRNMLPLALLGPEDIKPAQARGRSADGQKRPNSIKAHHAVNRSTQGRFGSATLSDHLILTTNFRKSSLQNGRHLDTKIQTEGIGFGCVGLGLGSGLGSGLGPWSIHGVRPR
jgi:hypothetical protein